MNKKQRDVVCEFASEMVRLEPDPGKLAPMLIHLCECLEGEAMNAGMDWPSETNIVVYWEAKIDDSFEKLKNALEDRLDRGGW